MIAFLFKVFALIVLAPAVALGGIVIFILLVILGNTLLH
jgi:hypothetical protein